MEKTKKESKEERFKRVAERRVRSILRDLQILSNCGNRGNYSYTENDFRKIFSGIDQAVREAKGKFHLPKDKEFKL